MLRVDHVPRPVNFPLPATVTTDRKSVPALADFLKIDGLNKYYEIKTNNDPRKKSGQG
jgi:hypothetical protein